VYRGSPDLRFRTRAEPEEVPIARCLHSLSMAAAVTLEDEGMEEIEYENLVWQFSMFQALRRFSESIVTRKF
jgi:hypothetical protein